jgi:hypothetical protein
MAPLPPGTKTIAIVPAFPVSFRVETLGPTVFGNKVDAIDMRGWGLEQAATDIAKQSLSPKYQVTEVPPDPAFDDDRSELNPFVNSSDNAGDFVRDHVHAQPVPDLYIVLTPDTRAEPYISEPVQPIAFGIMKMKAPFGFPVMHPFLHTFLELSIVDGRTFKLLYETPLLVPNTLKLPLADKLVYAREPLDVGEWHREWADMTDAQRALIESSARDLLVRSLTYTLGQMQIAN